MHNCKYLKVPILYLGKENRYFHEICHSSIIIYNLSIHQLLSEWLAELPAILERFYWYSQ